jgi:hypothetical protein
VEVGPGVSIQNKYHKSELIVIAGVIVAVILAAGIGAGRSGRAFAFPSRSRAVALYATSIEASGTAGGRFYLAFSVDAPGVDLDWVTPAVAALAGLGDLDIYVLPSSATGAATLAAEPDPMLAAAARAGIPATDASVIVIKGTCDGVPVPVQSVRASIQARSAGAITTVPIRHDPVLTAAALAAACSRP